MPKKKEIVLICVAHRDDETLGCAGAIQKHVKEKDKVFCLSMTDGVSSRSKKNLKINLLKKILLFLKKFLNKMKQKKLRKKNNKKFLKKMKQKKLRKKNHKNFLNKMKQKKLRKKNHKKNLKKLI